MTAGAEGRALRGAEGWMPVTGSGWRKGRGGLRVVWGWLRLAEGGDRCRGRFPGCEASMLQEVSRVRAESGVSIGAGTPAMPWVGDGSEGGTEGLP